MAKASMTTITSGGRAEYSLTFDTTNTGRGGADVYIPAAAKGVMVIYKGTSTASLTVAYTASTVAEIVAGTAVWLTTGTASTGGTSQRVDFAVPPTAIAPQIGTGLAGNQGYIAITAALV